MEASGAAVVTGAGRGLGRAIALELAVRGFDVHATLRRPEAAGALEAQAAAAVEAAGKGGSLVVRALDVTKPATLKLPDEIRVLVNNAGVEGPWLPVEAAPESLWREIFETNVFGLVEVTRRAIPALRRARGVVCNVTSCSIFAPMPFFAAYRASKAAVSALGDSLRLELEPFGVRVLEILPGAISTEMLAGVAGPPEAVALPDYEALAQKVHEHRAPSVAAGTPPEVAASAIVDAVLDDASPLRMACDPMGQALLDLWRGSDDESIQRSFRDLLGTRPSD